MKKATKNNWVNALRSDKVKLLRCLNKLDQINSVLRDAMHSPSRDALRTLKVNIEQALGATEMELSQETTSRRHK